MVSFGVVQVSNLQSFLHKNHLFTNFSLESFLLYGMKLGSSKTNLWRCRPRFCLTQSFLHDMWQLVSIFGPPVLLMRSGIIKAYPVVSSYCITSVLSCVCQRITILWETFEETFTNFEVLLLFAKVFSAKFGDVTFFDEQSGKFSL